MYNIIDARFVRLTQEKNIIIIVASSKSYDICVGNVSLRMGRDKNDTNTSTQKTHQLTYLMFLVMTRNSQVNNNLTESVFQKMHRRVCTSNCIKHAAQKL